MSYKKVMSLETIEKIDKTKILEQQVIGTSIHKVPVQYRILSKNDFGIHKNRINMGLFNKKNNFRVSEKESIMVINKNTLKLESPKIQEIINNSRDYFLIWKYSFSKRNNLKINLTDKYSNQNYDIKLTYEFAKNIVQNFSNFNSNKNFTESEKIFIDNFLNFNNEKITFNKYILINSNYKFLLGLLSVISKNGIIPNNINIYSIGLIFNLLEGSYSIRKENNEFITRYKFNSYLYKLLILDKEFDILKDLKYKFRNLKYFIYENKIVSKFLKFHDSKKDIYLMENNLDPIGINSGEIELIPCTDIVFEKLTNENDSEMSNMVDLVMENDNAHNFFLDGLPLLKNSDGDILAAMAIFTKEAAKEADDSFSASAKDRFVNPANLNIQQWGVKTDSALGLYNATK